MRAALLTCLALVAPLQTACVGASPLDYGDPTSLNTPTHQNGITAFIAAPKITDTLVSPQATLVVAAWTDAVPYESLSVTVSIDGDAAVVAAPSGSDGPEQRYHAPLALLHGANAIRVRIAASSGASRTLTYALDYDGEAPGLRLSLLAEPWGTDPCAGAPLPYGVTAATSVCAIARVTTRSGELAGLSVHVATAATETSGTTDASGRFEAALPLAADTTTTVDATVEAQTSAQVSVVQDGTPPVVAIDATAPETALAAVTLTGTASDAHGIAALWVESSVGGTQRLALENAGVASATWSAPIDLVVGVSALTVHARDLAGNEAEASVAIRRERLIHLSPPPPPAATNLVLDRAALEALLPPAVQESITLATVPLRPGILAALQAIRDPVASGLDTSAWGAAEWNLWKLLNMTPDNADVVGTSVEPLIDLSLAVGLPPGRILAETYGLGLTSTFVDPELLADVLLEQLIGTHPSAQGPDGQPVRDGDGNVALTVSLYDAFQNLTTLAPRFGPAGSHPGFLEGTSYSQLFEPGFLMSVPVRSNLTAYEGVAAAADTKDYLYVLEGAHVLAMDFLSPDFSVVGLVDAPTIDLTFFMTESPAFISAGTVRDANADPARPGFCRGDSAAWTNPPWETESVMAEMAYRAFAGLYAPTYASTLRYDAGSIVDAAILDWDHGWLTITTSGGLGAPPPPLYAWDLLSEVAQVRMHDGGLAEGEATTRFVLENLSVGVTTSELMDAMLPSLQASEGQISDMVVGSGGLVSSGVDVFYAPATDGGPGFFFFRAATDGFDADPATPAPPYPYATPGFFSDSALTSKLSTSAALAGTTDTAHEKVAVASVGQTLYFADATARVFELELVSLDANGLTVRVAEVP